MSIAVVGSEYVLVARGDIPPVFELDRIPEVASRLDVSRSEVHELLATGALPSVTIDRTRLVRADDLRAFDLRAFVDALEDGRLVVRTAVAAQRSFTARCGRDEGRSASDDVINVWALATRPSCGSEAWAEFISFLDHDVAIPAVICSTTATERLNARWRPAVEARGHVPTGQAAMKCLHLGLRRPTLSAR